MQALACVIIFPERCMLNSGYYFICEGSMRIMMNVLKSWLPLAAAIVFLSGMIEVTVQQNFRSGANDPQVQMAEDAARALESGQPASGLIPAGKVDIAASQTPYLVLYGPEAQPTAGNGYLNGNLAVLPRGVFDHAAKNGRNQVTWQPEPGVRSAVVIFPVNGGKGGYALAGRSLREVEAREDNLTLLVAAGCGGALAATLVLTLLLEILPVKKT
jgi:hypothetical protein